MEVYKSLPCRLLYTGECRKQRSPQGRFVLPVTYIYEETYGFDIRIRRLRKGMWNDMKKISKTVWGMGILLMVLMMTGCGEAKVPTAIDKPMISIAKSGEVTEYLVGEFSGKDYYDVSELSSMAAEEAARYNTANQTGTVTPVKMEKVEVLEDGSGRVCIVYQYDSAESYTGFNEASLFYGTVDEAVSQGYSVDISLMSVNSSGQTLTADQLRQTTDKKLIIAPWGVHIYCPGRVEYISDNAAMADDGSVDAAGAEGPVYILVK